MPVSPEPSLHIIAIEDRGDARGPFYFAPKDAIEFLGEVRDMRAGVSKPGVLRGNNFNLASRQAIVVIHESEWTLHWDFSPDLLLTGGQSRSEDNSQAAPHVAISAGSEVRLITMRFLPTPAQVPQLIRYSSVVPNADAARAQMVLRFAIFATREGGTALWSEEQTVSVAPSGAFNALLGARTEGGVPSALFVAGEARWIAVSVDGTEVGPRAVMVSVPYAMKAADAETLGGLPLSAFVTREEIVTAASATGGVTTLSGANTNSTRPALGAAANVGTSTSGYIPVWTDSVGTLGNSSFFQNGSGLIGIGTAAPAAALDIEQTTATGVNAFNSGIRLNNSAPITGVVSAMNMQFVDASTANVLSKQTMRLGYTRDASATGNVNAFDSMLTTSASFYSNASFTIRALNIEGPGVVAGKSLYRFVGIWIGAPSAGVGTMNPLITEPGSGNVGIGTLAPTQLLEVAGNVKISGGGALMFADGTSQTTAATGGGSGVTITSPDSSITVGGTAIAPTVAVNSVAAGKVTGQVSDTQIAGMSASKLTGTISDTQIAGMAANKLTGTISDTQIAGMSASKLTGTVSDTQIAGMSASKLIGQVSFTQIAGTTCSTGQVMQWTGSSWACVTLSGGSGGGGATLGSNSFTGNQTVTGIVSASVSGTAAYALNGVNTSTASGDGIDGSASGANGRGVYGIALATGSATGIGVDGISQGDQGTGVQGLATSATGANFGVVGITSSSQGRGVYGKATSLATGGSGFPSGVYGESVGGSSASVGVYGLASNATTTNTTYGVTGISASPSGVGVLGWSSTTSTSGSSTPVGIWGEANSVNGLAGYFSKTVRSGYVLWVDVPNTSGVVAPIMRLSAFGNLTALGSVSGGGADFAEMIEVAGAAKSYAPGDVLVISESGDRRVQLSSEPYSTRVVGVYSTKPGVVGSPHPMTETVDGEIPMAMVGIVPCKASAENGAIRRGDLLVTSSIPGHVMRATDRSRITGAVVGKALQPLEKATGVIEIAVTLQ
jgi:hypothetical protein